MQQLNNSAPNPAVKWVPNWLLCIREVIGLSACLVRDPPMGVCSKLRFRASYIERYKAVPVGHGSGTSIAGVGTRGGTERRDGKPSVQPDQPLTLHPWVDSEPMAGDYAAGQARWHLDGGACSPDHPFVQLLAAGGCDLTGV